MFALGGAAVDDIVYLLQCAAQVAGIEPPEAPYWAEAIHFPLYFIAPGGGSLANFADAGGPRGCPPYLLRLAQWLVEHGITSISANIDAIPKIRERVARTERRIILDSARRNA